MTGRKSTAAMELAIGATIIAGVLILVVMLMAWGNSSSLLGSHYRVVVTMANVGGLKEGAPVKLGGFQIGRVANIRFQPGTTEIEIVLDIDENRDIPGDSTAKVSTAGLVGDAFMEIVPGKSTTMAAHARSDAEAARLDSSPVPDMSAIMSQVASIGAQVNELTESLNELVGDPQFRKSIKSAAANIDSVAHQANLLLQRSKTVEENINAAAKNVAELSTTLRTGVEKATGDLAEITGSAKSVIANIDAGVTDVRNAVNSTLGDPEVAKNLSGAVANINSVTSLLAKRNDATEKLLANLGEVTEDLKAVSAKVREITGEIDPATVGKTLNSLSAAIDSMTDVVEKVKSEPVLALSINKAADRIVKMKFDEMAKQRLTSADSVLDEVTRWVKGNMDQGFFDDPAYSYGVRPYALPEVESTQITGNSAAERQPYLVE